MRFVPFISKIENKIENDENYPKILSFNLSEIYTSNDFNKEINHTKGLLGKLGGFDYGQPYRRD